MKRSVAVRCIAMITMIVAAGFMTGARAIAQTATPVAGSPVPSGVTFVASGLSNPRGFSWAPDGTLYLAQAGTGGDTVQVAVEGFTALGGETSSVDTIADGCAQTVVGGIHSVLWKEAGWIWGAMDIEFLGDVPYVL